MLNYVHVLNLFTAANVRVSSIAVSSLLKTAGKKTYRASLYIRIWCDVATYVILQLGHVDGGSLIK